LYAAAARVNIQPTRSIPRNRVLRCKAILNVAVKQKRLAANPCLAVEFPVSAKKSTRKPHYMSATEQAKIEIVAPSYVRNIVVIISELGLRYKKELLSMKKEQVDLENGVVHVADSKRGERHWRYAVDSRRACGFQAPDGGNGGKRVSVPQPKSGVPYFALYELRHTFATRLSAGGVADHMVTQMLRQGDADVFKLYSQAKLGMMREALAKLDRQANERGVSSTTLAS
jgi:integrase